LGWIGTGEIELFGTSYAALEGITEVFRSSAVRRSPFAGLPAMSDSLEVPVVRVYEVEGRW
ncbi:MAG: hypothetical protein OEM62_06880, partial [Acidobacteriota bacterium]|nr:hypothetical protein [Acidobacteriota bacterium]